ncbi:MAG TPA: hypothetical protein VNS81_10305 [Nocardioides sp.]|nr:hypothetical protein [Nocardioides sp.]
MNENDDPSNPASDATTPQPADGEGAVPPSPPTPPLPPAAAMPPAPQQRWRERLYGVRSVAAVALASLVVGAGLGTGITLLAQGDDQPGHLDRFERMHGPGDGRLDDGGPAGGFGGPGNATS